MKVASDYRLEARNSLRNKWWIAVLAGFLAVILGAVGDPNIELNFNFHDFSIDGFMDQLELQNMTVQPSPFFRMFVGVGTTLALITSVAYAIVKFVVGAVVSVGYASFNLQLSRGTPSVNGLFAYFPNWKNLIASRFWRWLYIFLWSLLLVIPGIMAAYSYQMTDFILAENPNMAARDAMLRSKEMMQGNRFRLFCLQFSFIGWSILSSLALGIGFVWLIPYTQAAKAAFYRDLVLHYNS